ncbi:2724_t:CDS:1 [Ambispora leptoticha]|uniref:2724_t:CDS:1 n=1 Tax=Ambispora leptoticha TaxID=144679 RepID=A0A9N8VRL3_9GLOM|nr:2724_t:CDS:1 [Ambispora leptoticha]
MANKNMNKKEICNLAKQLYNYVQLCPSNRSVKLLREDLIKKGEKMKALPNKFMIFLTFMRNQFKTSKIPQHLTTKITTQNIAAKIASEIWKLLSLKQKDVYLEIYKAIKSEHQQKYAHWKANQRRIRSDFNSRPRN